MGSYGESHLSTQRIETSSATSLHVKLAQIPNEDSYTVQPYTYWAKGGYLVVDYLVHTGTAALWHNVYNKPDPAFNLPWRDGACGEERKLQTREITFSPAKPRNGDTVTISATVRNYSPVGTNRSLTVRFYNADPAMGDQQIGTDQTIARLNPRETTTVQTQWVAHGDGPQKIYAVIDPGNQIAEAYAELHATRAGQPAVRRGRSARARSVAGAAASRRKVTITCACPSA